MERVILTHEENQYPDSERKSINVKEKRLFIVTNYKRESDYGHVIGYFNDSIEWFLDSAKVLFLENERDYLVFKLHHSAEGDKIAFDFDIVEIKQSLSINNKVAKKIDIPHGVGINIHFDSHNFSYVITDWKVGRNMNAPYTSMRKNDKSPYFISFNNDDEELRSMLEPMLYLKADTDEEIEITIEFVNR